MRIWERIYTTIDLILYVLQDPNVPTPEWHDVMIGTYVILIIFLLPWIIVRRLKPRGHTLYLATDLLAGTGMVLALLIILPYAAVQV
jgi:hypothetical protein